MPEQPAPLLTVAELADLRAAVLYGYEGGRPPTDLPPRIATYAYEPDGGLIDVIDLATRYAARVAELEAELDESRGDAGRAHGQAWALLARTVELQAQVAARDARVAELEAAEGVLRAGLGLCQFGEDEHVVPFPTWNEWAAAVENFIRRNELDDPAGYVAKLRARVAPATQEGPTHA